MIAGFAHGAAGPIGRTAAAVILALATLAAPAAASTLTKTGSTIVYNAGSLEANRLTVSHQGTDYVFAESGGVIIDEDCGTGASAPSVLCGDSGVTVIQIFLQDNDDVLTIDNSVAAAGQPTILAEGGSGDDTLNGGNGPESLCGGDDNDRLNGGGGNDRLDFPCTDPQVDQTSGSDTLNGGPGDDQLNGGPERSPEEADTLIGGDGVDTADYSQRTAPLTITLDGVSADGEAGEGDNVASDVDNVIGGAAGDVLVGSPSPNALDGRDGNDTVAGDDGNDTVIGADGDDQLDGGGGSDALWGGGGTDSLTGAAGDDTLNGGAGIDSLDGGDGNDTLNGSEPGLVGADGNDTLRGGLGADTLLGGPGDDWLDGGLGPDQINGQDGRDTLSYEARPTPVTVKLDGKPNDGERNEGDNVANDVETVLGGSLSDTLEGNNLANVFQGGLGEDFVRGNGGVDTLDSGGGADLVWARDGTHDTVDCGGGGDLVVMDRNDDARNCRWFDRSGSRSPTLARSALVSGSSYTYRMPVGHRDYDLDGSLRFPSGSRIDAERTVRVTTATTANGGRENMSVSGGPFTIKLSRSATDYRFVKGAQGCSRGRPRAPTDARTPRITMQIDKGKRPARKRRARQRATVRGKHSIGAAFGTKWITEERCSGTFTKVLSGTVRVLDIGRKRTVLVRKGHSYLARAR